MGIGRPGGGQGGDSLWEHPMARPCSLTVPNLEVITPADNPGIPRRASHSEKGARRTFSGRRTTSGKPQGNWRMVFYTFSRRNISGFYLVNWRNVDIFIQRKKKDKKEE